MKMKTALSHHAKFAFVVENLSGLMDIYEIIGNHNFKKT